MAHAMFSQQCVAGRQAGSPARPTQHGYLLTLSGRHMKKMELTRVFWGVFSTCAAQGQGQQVQAQGG
jgi:hypothetical protein